MQQVRFILERQNNVLYVVCVLYITQFLFLDIDGVRVLHCPVGYLWRSCSSLALIRDKCGSFCTTLVLLRDICGDLVFYTSHAVIYLWSSICIIFMFQMCCFVRSDFAISTFTLCFTSIVFSLLIFLLVRFLLILFCTGVIYSECAFCTVPSKWYFIIQLCCFVTPDYARVLAIYLNLNKSLRTEF